jgi:Asp-tRNA(Asn)/Glu-tRNA(Gln) amidotransferase A subunit family amidase
LRLPPGWPAGSATAASAALELLDFTLACAERHNPVLNASHRLANRCRPPARPRGRSGDGQGELEGPLHGIPMTVKESFIVAGLPTTFGNPQWKGNIATSNAVDLPLLRSACALPSAGRRHRGRDCRRERASRPFA